MGKHEGKSEDIPDIVDFTRQRLGFDPNSLQEFVLRGGRRVSRIARGSGANRRWRRRRGASRAYCQTDSMILVLSPSARQSGEFVRKAEEFVSRLGIKARGDGGNEISTAFPNRSRMVGLPHNEATARGFSKVSLMLVDEASRVGADLYRAMRPSIDAEFLADERKNMTDALFRKEYMCEFGEAEGRAFSQESIDAAFQDLDSLDL